MKTGLISVTFRNKSIDEIAAIARQAGLQTIEWGGDVHVPPTDPAAAAAAVKACKDNGLTVSAYGSYYRCKDEENFAPILETAVRLGAPVIRVWAGGGFKHSSQCSEEDRAMFTRNLGKAVAMAAEKGCIVATECHPNTLTDDINSTLRLLEDVPGLYTYWQPFYNLTYEENEANIRRLGKKIVNVHIFHRDENNKPTPLSAGAENWKHYIKAIRECTATQSVGMEFVMGGTDAQFFEDSQVFADLINI